MQADEDLRPGPATIIYPDLMQLRDRGMDVGNKVTPCPALLSIPLYDYILIRERMMTTHKTNIRPTWLQSTRADVHTEGLHYTYAECRKCIGFHREGREQRRLFPTPLLRRPLKV